MNTERVSSPHSGSHPAPWAYAWWAVAGALLGFGLASILTIGLLLLLLAVLLAVAGFLLKPLRNHAAAAVLGGLGVAALYLAWLNREGPGRVCETTTTSTSCVEEWSPWPFLVVALLLITATVFLVRLARR
ncbi:hypothetical protein [Micromonospora tarensis]|uniref:MYXO-CTERM domain-containing protein n=1 Tax=Micromonospora tarensis TaxID=2806100 RepID=A0ABS1YJM2_9ACTN|nr:hypothetical protein [Micromonospora tarensis]MBM0277627.1 hypothetical protein [Micromonospora tarensis]